jgi:methyl-accepting chemotaxis protein
MSLKSRLTIAFLALLIVPGATIGWFSYQKASGSLAKGIEANASESVRHVDQLLSHYIASGLHDLDYLASAVNEGMIDGGGNPKIRTVFDSYMAVKPELDHVHYASDTGFILFSNDQRMEEGYDPRTRPWYVQAMQREGDAVVNDPVVAPDGTGDIAVLLSKKADDGSGVVASELLLSSLAERVKSIRIGEKGYVTILDRELNYLVHPTMEAGKPLDPALAAIFGAAPAGTVDYEFGGKPKRAVYRTNPATGWVVVGGIELSEIRNASEGVLYTTLLVIAAAVLLGGWFAYRFVRSVTKPLQELTQATERIASGNLCEVVPIRSADEFGRLSASVNDMAGKLKGLIGDIVGSSHNLAAASQQISSATEQVASGSSSQAESALVMKESFDRLSEAIASVVDRAEEAATLASKSTEVAREGGRIVLQSIEGMNGVELEMRRLESDSTKIGAIIEAIDDIADQTKLLALNAAIEAARAGEHGRGFAVVAGEVRKLADRSVEATKQITSIIREMQDNMRRSVTAVVDGAQCTERTGEAFEHIARMIGETERVVGDIAVASRSQARQSDEVMLSIESISATSQEAAAASEQTAATSQELAKLAESLQETVSVFKVR